MCQFLKKIPWTSIPVLLLCFSGLVLAVGSWILEWVEISVSIQSPSLQTTVYILHAVDSPIFVATAAAAVLFNLIGLWDSSRILLSSKFGCCSLFITCDLAMLISAGFLWNWYMYQLTEQTVAARLQPNQRLLAAQAITSPGYGCCLVSHSLFCLASAIATLIRCGSIAPAAAPVEVPVGAAVVDEKEIVEDFDPWPACTCESTDSEEVAIEV